ncbi:carbohydrate kinase family protein [Pseudonocardia phyllosphaerae]|uniref:carbohydrate kinase family protein n=1 Tax=Pseudonocardia phyllosphaerae TaxID=3390502 RepID=UPI0039796CE2
MLGVLGDLVEDVVVWVSGPVRHGTDTPARVFRSRGGSGANVAAAAARFGPTRFLGSVGADPLGDALVAGLAADGVDVRVRRGGRTGSVVVLVGADGERTMLPDRGAAAELDDVPGDWLHGLDLLHVPAYAFDGEPGASATRAAVTASRVAGTRISVDTSSAGMITGYGVAAFRDLLVALSPDVLLADDGEAALLGLWSGAAPGPFRSALPDTVVVVKAGAAPTRVSAPGAAPFTVPVAPVPGVCDVTGAGDAFAAGFLSTRLRAGDLRESCVAGHAAAARVLRSPGAG